MKNILLLALISIALIMLFLGFKASMLPPALTGVGFLVIAILFFYTNKK